MPPHQKGNNMAIEYCHRGDHYVDLDHFVEGAYGITGKFEWCCGTCMTDEEVDHQEHKENFWAKVDVARRKALSELTFEIFEGNIAIDTCRCDCLNKEGTPSSRSRCEHHRVAYATAFKEAHRITREDH